MKTFNDSKDNTPKITDYPEVKNDFKGYWRHHVPISNHLIELDKQVRDTSI